MTRKSPSEIHQNRGEGAMKGWQTRKANEQRRARNYDAVLAENRKLKAALRGLLAQIKTSVVNSASAVYRDAAELVGGGE